MSEDIYRIISFPSFVNLITTKKERYVHPLLWDDTHEGLYYSMLNRPELCEKLLRALYKNYNDLSATLTNFLKVYIFPAFTYAQCWSTLSESDALWRIYSYDNMSVQIHTTVEDLSQLLEKDCSTNNERIFIDDVKYDLTGTVNEMFEILQNIILEERKISDPFFHKRIAFEHEKEKRVIIYDKESANSYICFKPYYFIDRIKEVCPNLESATIEHLVSEFRTFISDKPYKYDVNHSKFVAISDDLSKYIKSVKLNPFSPNWIDNLVEKLCFQNGLNYVGRSKLYERI